MTDDTVLVSTNNATRRAYHTDPDCSLLGDGPREWPREDAVAFGYEECTLCAADGDWSAIAADEQAPSLRQLLDSGAVEHTAEHPASRDGPPGGGR
jgi:hypothetical protein